MKTVILAMLMILSATITHAQDNYSLTKEGNSYICKGSKPCKIDERTTFGSAALWAMEKSSNVVENTLKCDPQKLVLSVGCNIAENENSDKVYTFQLNIAVNKVFHRYHISTRPAWTYRYGYHGHSQYWS